MAMIMPKVDACPLLVTVLDTIFCSTGSRQPIAKPCRNRKTKICGVIKRPPALTYQVEVRHHTQEHRSRTSQEHAGREHVLAVEVVCEIPPKQAAPEQGYRLHCHHDGHLLLGEAQRELEGAHTNAHHLLVVASDE
ncbi:PD-(D/E)XK nuclease family protein [Babesia caballi]|uniref:PD-(D/E)XK nuclease family protein n=1 Tax=Babesia caballi TaxID=5871 RepID=A0AAV4LVD9_BABCB|nr:PD-(D/E)XK nuclease family protein [Babesia caballi]